MDLPGGAPPAASTNAVRIMSIHASKGLEFPVVFLAGLGGQFNRETLSADLLLHPRIGAGIKRRDPITYNRYDTLPHLGLSLAIRNDTRAEELRILYVAMTRAREKLCMVMTQNNPTGKLTSLAASLTEDPTLSPFSILGASSMSDWILAATLRHPSANELRRHIDREDLPTLPADTAWRIELCNIPIEAETVTDAQASAVADPTLVATIREHMAYVYPHNALARIPSKLAASESAHEQFSHAFIARSRPAFLSRSGLTPSERGTAMHAFMQFASYTAAAVSPAEEARRLVDEGFLTDEQAKSLDNQKLIAFFNSSLYKRMTQSPRFLREFHFTCRRSAADLDHSLSADINEFLVVQGIADCVFEENGKLVIVDYKTDRVSRAEELITRYRPQLEIYRTAIGTALKTPVSECWLYSFALGREIAVGI